MVESLIKPQLHKLYVDLFNYGDYFFKPDSNHWMISRSQKKIKAFVEACENSNIHIEVFIGDSNTSEESKEKWKYRREEEVIIGKKSMP
jgi:hypothetical protein